MNQDTHNPLTRPSATLSPSDGERDGVRGIVPRAGVITEAVVLDALRQVLDPEIGMNIVDLGLIYDVRITGSEVRVAMTLTTAGCPMSESIRSGAELVLLNLEGVTAAHVELVFDPPWHPGMISQTTASPSV